jgi:hypothetical protein
MFTSLALALTNSLEYRVNITLSENHLADRPATTPATSV